MNYLFDRIYYKWTFAKRVSLSFSCNQLISFIEKTMMNFKSSIHINLFYNLNFHYILFIYENSFLIFLKNDLDTKVRSLSYLMCITNRINCKSTQLIQRSCYHYNIIIHFFERTLTLLSSTLFYLYAPQYRYFNDYLHYVLLVYLVKIKITCSIEKEKMNPMLIPYNLLRRKKLCTCFFAFYLFVYWVSPAND